MIRYLIAFLLAVASTGCITPTKGAPFQVYASIQGDIQVGYDLNTAVAVGEGTVYAVARDTTMKTPLYTPLVAEGDFAYVRIRDFNGEEVNERFERPPAPDKVVVPAKYMAYVHAVLSPAELERARVTFEAADPPSP